MDVWMDCDESLSQALRGLARQALLETPLPHYAVLRYNYYGAIHHVVGGTNSAPIPDAPSHHGPELLGSWEGWSTS